MTTLRRSACERCDICDIAFTERRSLLRHQRSAIHASRAGTQSQRLACSFSDCAHTFAREDNRRRHEDEIHRKIKRRRVLGSDSELRETSVLDSVEVDSRDFCASDRPESKSSAPFRYMTPARSKALTPVSEAEEAKADDEEREPTPKTPATWYTKMKAAGPPRTPSPTPIGNTPPRPRTKRSANGVLFKCPQCHRHFGNQEERFLCHVAEHSLFEEYMCRLCDVGFRHEADLTHHMRSVADDGHCGFAFQHEKPCTGHHSADDPDAQRFKLGSMLRAWEGAQLRLHGEDIREAVLKVAKRRDDEPLSQTPCPRSLGQEWSELTYGTPRSCPRPWQPYNKDLLVNKLSPGPVKRRLWDSAL